MARVRPARRVLHRHLRFCPVTLSSDLAAAPLLTAPIELALTLVGIGAIGTGVARILSELDVFGRVLAVDCERLASENRGTYSLGGVAEVNARPTKVELAEATLTRFDVIPFPHRVEELPAAIDRQNAPWLPLVVSGLDTPEARRETQRLWPDRLVDAATGDTMLGLHEHAYGRGPCTRCFFPETRDGPSAAQRLSEITGLPVALLVPAARSCVTSISTISPPTSEPSSSRHLGNPVCGLARTFGLTDLDAADYQPSAPFISLQAASLAIGRVLAHKLDLNGQPNFVQYDGLYGPQTATLDTMQPCRRLLLPNPLANDQEGAAPPVLCPAQQARAPVADG